jgi:hypothetical protein
MDYRLICLDCEYRHHGWFCKKYHDPIFVASKKCIKNPDWWDTLNQTKKSDNMTRLEELANMSVDSGSFLKFDNGYVILFQITDFENIPEVEKTYDGKPAGKKHQWSVLLKEVKIMDLPTVQYKRAQNPEKCNKIEGQQVNKKYILELGKKATKRLSKYILDNGIKTNHILKFWRTGEQAQTVYTFMTEATE